MNRRELLQALGAAWAGGFTWTRQEVEAAEQRARQARRAAARAGTAYKPKFFTEHEWRTVRLLADMIIPRDERSGSASDAGVPEFMDFMMIDQPWRQVPMRGGLAWLDLECRERFGRVFVECSDRERAALLDELAWPGRARPELAHGVAFFNSFRDLTATGFWTSKMGIEDLQYMGNTFVAEWKGCPEAQLKRLGVSYDT
ncbi:MAG TPA: gluconate 2-dehydrogenase subunit 3 family protein [Vicinamibacterales bacterium]|nr:gluconate 2-dehydrogenase subunit 3 family protein [Vicinamibacterales bacterium]